GFNVHFAASEGSNLVSAYLNFCLTASANCASDGIVWEFQSQDDSPIRQGVLNTSMRGNATSSASTYIDIKGIFTDSSDAGSAEGSAEGLVLAFNAVGAGANPLLAGGQYLNELEGFVLLEREARFSHAEFQA